LTRPDKKTGTRDMNRQGFRALHIDFINNDEKQGYRVTFDNTVFPPIITRPEMTAGEFIDGLMKEASIIHKISTLGRFRTLLRI